MFRLVEHFKEYGAKAKYVYCGGSHTHILTTDGEVLSCGLGEYGRLGTGSTSDALVPTTIDTFIDEDIIQVATGQSHSIALTKGGQLYSWGRNDSGQLGHADSFMDMYSMESFPRPIDMELFKGSKIVSIAAGKARSAAVTDKGELYTWGERLNHVPTIRPPEDFQNKKVIKVVCCGDAWYSCTAVITEDHTLWTYGDASSTMIGRAGLSRMQKVTTPELVPTFKDMKVEHVFGGLGFHMAAIVRTI